MVLGFIVAGASFLPAVMNIGSKVVKQYKRVPYRNQLAGASAFGLGYGGATNIGYNLSNTYLTSGFRPTKYFNSRNSYNLQMPYGRSYYPRRRNYQRYIPRRFNRYQRPYRRYSRYY